MMASCSLRRSLERSSADVFLNDWKALSAASMARRVSALPALGTVPSFSPVAGLVTSTVAPESACTHSPSMRLAWRMNWLVFWSMASSVRALSQRLRLNLVDSGGSYRASGVRFNP